MTADRCLLASLLTVGLLLTAAVLLHSGPVAGAAEPDGRVRIEATWVERGDPASLTPGRLQVRLSPLAAVEDARLTVTMPTSVTLRPRLAASSIELREVPSRGGERALEAELGRLASAVVFELDVEVAPDSGGIAAVVVEARTDRGRPFREALGVVVGKTGPQATRRLGAVEYPAAVRPRARDE